MLLLANNLKSDFESLKTLLNCINIAYEPGLVWWVGENYTTMPFCADKSKHIIKPNVFTPKSNKNKLTRKYCGVSSCSIKRNAMKIQKYTPFIVSL